MRFAGIVAGCFVRDGGAGGDVFVSAGGDDRSGRDGAVSVAGILAAAAIRCVEILMGLVYHFLVHLIIRHKLYFDERFLQNNLTIQSSQRRVIPQGIFV